MRQLYKTQLTNAAFAGKKSLESGQRFRGVARSGQDPGVKGELFGLENLLKYSKTSILAQVAAAAKKSDRTGDPNQFRVADLAAGLKAAKSPPSGVCFFLSSISFFYGSLFFSGGDAARDLLSMLGATAGVSTSGAILNRFCKTLEHLESLLVSSQSRMWSR